MGVGFRKCVRVHALYNINVGCDGVTFLYFYFNFLFYIFVPVRYLQHYVNVLYLQLYSYISYPYNMKIKMSKCP